MRAVRQTITSCAANDARGSEGYLGGSSRVGSLANFANNGRPPTVRIPKTKEPAQRKTARKRVVTVTLPRRRCAQFALLGRCFGSVYCTSRSRCAASFEVRVVYSLRCVPLLKSFEVADTAAVRQSGRTKKALHAILAACA